MNRLDAHELVLTELKRQTDRVRSGDLRWCVQSEHMGNESKLRVLAEEFSEVAVEVGAEDSEKLKTELVQVAATAMGWLESLP